MYNNPYHPRQWKNLIPNIDAVIRELEQKPILSVGITPYTRIIPAFFLNKYAIYTVQRSSDVDIMEQFLSMYVLEDKHPEVAARVHGTGYLIGNHYFQGFVRAFKQRPTLMFYTMTKKIIEDLDKLGMAYIGNDPKTFEDVMYKQHFKALVKKLGLPVLPTRTYLREAFFEASYEQLQEEVGNAFVVQRGDKETGGNEGTFFIHSRADFDRCREILVQDKSFSTIVCARFVSGHSTSMLGCVMREGTLSGPLQLQLIDVPQSLHGVSANGIFFGNDLGFVDWEPVVEDKAQEVVEAVGDYLRNQGYKGIFGIDFLYDKETKEIFASECNPRFTGSLVLYSLMLLEAGVPPMEFFHLLAHLNIQADFDFGEVNRALKARISCAHIAFSPRGITNMELSFPAGVYECLPGVGESLSYKRPGISLADLKNENEFLLADTVPNLHAPIEQQVPRLFKFIFRRSIARSSYEIDESAGLLVKSFADALLNASQKASQKKNPSVQTWTEGEGV
jgi:hypothetical protein